MIGIGVQRPTALGRQRDKSIIPNPNRDATALSHRIILSLRQQVIEVQLFRARTNGLVRTNTVPNFLRLCIKRRTITTNIVDALASHSRVASARHNRNRTITGNTRFHPVCTRLFNQISNCYHKHNNDVRVGSLSVKVLKTGNIIKTKVPVTTNTTFTTRCQNSQAITITFFNSNTDGVKTFRRATGLTTILGLPILFIYRGGGCTRFAPRDQRVLLSSIHSQTVTCKVPNIIYSNVSTLSIQQIALRTIRQTQTNNNPALVRTGACQFCSRRNIGKLHGACQAIRRIRR